MSNDTERRAFENHMRYDCGYADCNFRTSNFSNRTYESNDMEHMFRGWKARAAREQAGSRGVGRITREEVTNILNAFYVYDKAAGGRFFNIEGAVNDLMPYLSPAEHTQGGEMEER